MEVNKQKEVVDACLKMFVSKGLFETTSRDLSKALQLQSGGLYYYFKSKDEVVVSCAEEATIRIESTLILPVLKELQNHNEPDEMMSNLRKHADAMAPMMRFLTQVATVEKYKEDLKPVLDSLSKRYKTYAEKFAEYFRCSVEEIEPFVYMCITAVVNYMIFGEDSYIYPQINMIKSKIRELYNKRGE